MSREKIAYSLLAASYYIGFLSWLFFFLFLLGMGIQNETMNIVGVFGAVGSITLSIVLEEISNRLYGEGNIVGILLVVVALGCAGASVYGFTAGNNEVLAGAVVTLLLASFVPGIMDFFHRDYSDVEENSSPADSHGQIVDTGVFEMFGVHVPKEPAPIVQENGQDYDDLESRFGVTFAADEELGADAVYDENMFDDAAEAEDDVSEDGADESWLDEEPAIDAVEDGDDPEALDEEPADDVSDDDEPEDAPGDDEDSVDVSEDVAGEPEEEPAEVSAPVSSFTIGDIL